MHIIMGLVLYFNPETFQTTQGATTHQMPREAGLFFVAVGSFAVLLGWTFGILTILSGKMIGRLKHRTFSLVIAGLNCLSVPFGTALGVCTFIVLLRENVITTYENAGDSEVETQA